MELPDDVSGAQERFPLGPTKAVLIFLAFLGTQIVVGMLVGVVGGIWIVATRGAAGPAVLAEMERTVVMPAAALGLLVGGLVALLLTRVIFRASPRATWMQFIGWSAARRTDLLLAALAGVVLAVFYLFVLVLRLPPAPGQQWGPVVRAVRFGGWPRHVWVGLAVLVAPPVEEFVFRGVLLAGFSRSWTAASAGTLVTLLFVTCHLTEIWGYAPAMLSVLALGMATLFARVRTHSLAPAIALHAAYNLALAVFVYVEAA
jgi:membrane protease YdiL (CAAX protease family)